MLSTKLLILFSSLASARVFFRTPLAVSVPKTSDSECCFYLADTTLARVVKEVSTENNGLSLSVSGCRTDAVQFCIGLSSTNDNGVLRDSANNACIVNYSDRRISCLDGTPGDRYWALKKVDGVTLLEYGGVTKVYSCPSSNGQKLYGSSVDKIANGCTQTRLMAYDLTSSCASLLASS